MWTRSSAIARRRPRYRCAARIAVIGDLSQPATYAAAAAKADGSIHTAMDDSSRGHALDALALDTLLAPVSAPRPGRFFIYTSGVWVLGPAPAPVDEGSPINPIELSAWRAPHEQRVLAAAGPHLRTAVVRPGIVYGGSRGIVGDMFKAAARRPGPGDWHRRESLAARLRS